MKGTQKAIACLSKSLESLSESIRVFGMSSRFAESWKDPPLGYYILSKGKECKAEASKWLKRGCVNEADRFLKAHDLWFRAYLKNAVSEEVMR